MGYFSSFVGIEDFDREQDLSKNTSLATVKNKETYLQKKKQYLLEKKQYLARYGEKKKPYSFEKEENEISDLEYGRRC